MNITIAEENWTAHILFSPQSAMDGFMHCIAQIRGASENECLNGAQVVLDLFAKGRNTFVRIPPEAATDRDFDSKEEKYGGFVRFSFRLEAGSWHYAKPDEPTHIPSLAAQA